MNDATATPIRVVTLNMRGGYSWDGWHSWPFRRHAAVTILRELDADVIALQEVYRFQEAWLLRGLTDHLSFASVGRNDGRRGQRCPIFVRRGRFHATSCITRWFSTAPERPGSRLDGASFPRTAALVELLDVVTGCHFGIANVHLDEHLRENRMESIRLLCSWIHAAIPWIVAGDINATPDDPELEALRRAGYHSALPSGEPGTAHDFTGTLSGRRIDHLLVSAGAWEVKAAEVVARRVDGRLPSDHWPVVADVVPKTKDH